MNDILPVPVPGAVSKGRDPATGVRWTFEPAAAHDAAHAARELEYWLARPPGERLTQADEYRLRFHGPSPQPVTWPWRFVDPLEPGRS